MLLDKSTVETALQLPGFQNWQPEFDVLHLSRPRERPEHLPGTGRFAGVVLLLYTAHQATHLVLTRRRDDLKHHPGQISLPGGSVEPGESVRDAALRETKEEIDVTVTPDDVIGQLNSIYIPPSDFTVQPFVSWMENRPVMRPADHEVAEIIDSPVSRLFDPDAFQTGPVRSGNRTLTAPHYCVADHQVWGATALMLSEFVARLSALSLDS